MEYADEQFDVYSKGEQEEGQGTEGEAEKLVIQLSFEFKDSCDHVEERKVFYDIVFGISLCVLSSVAEVLLMNS